MLEILLDDADVIDVLAYVIFANGRDEQIIHNDLFYRRVMFAQLRMKANLNLAIDAHALAKSFKTEPQFLSDIQKRFNLNPIKFY